MPHSLDENREYDVNIPFEGRLKENLVGFYRSKFFDKSTKHNSWLAVTHFEPSDARRAFPCFDEPAFKATFTIELGHHQSFNALSNMPLKNQNKHNSKADYVWSTFQKTLPMSTYLVGFMISKFKSTQSTQTDSKPEFRVWTRREASKQAAFAASIGPKFLTFYGKYFGIDYPLPKQDLLAIPDFKIGAMENWGIVTFRESSLLLDEDTTSTSTKLHIATIIAHELAHMWFGNLVTMNWWTDLWLKEGFATYLAGVAVQHVFPEWDSLDAEALSDLLRVFHLDSLKSSHPVSVKIENPKEISQIFDAISYDKGSFLLRMMNLYVGDEAFRHGVSAYLKEHQLSNAEQDDLWASLTKEAHRFKALPESLTVKKIMDTWTLQTGFPIITVKRDYKSNKVTIEQRRYIAIETEDEVVNKGGWWVPLSYSTENEPHFNQTQPNDWMSADNERSVIEVNAKSDEWIIFNNRAAGLYKVNYDKKNWELLIKALNSEKFKVIDVLNRALLIIDAMDLADNGLHDYELALSLVKYVKKEIDFVPWNAALTKLEPLNTKLCRTPLYGTFKVFMQALLTPVVEKVLGVLKDCKPSTFGNARLINFISHWVLPLDVGNLTSQAKELFQLWSSDPNPDLNNPIPKEIRRAVYGSAVDREGEAAWNFLWERYKKANVAAEKNNILMALTNTKEVWLINRYLEWTLNETSGIRKQDAFIIFKVMAKKEVGFYVAQKFFYRNIKLISEYFGANSNLIGHYFSAVADQMIYQFEYDELKEFSEKHKDLLAPASLTVKQALESVQLNIRWIEKHYDSISKALSSLLPDM